MRPFQFQPYVLHCLFFFPAVGDSIVRAFLKAFEVSQKLVADRDTEIASLKLANNARVEEQKKQEVVTVSLTALKDGSQGCVDTVYVTVVEFIHCKATELKSNLKGMNDLLMNISRAAFMLRSAFSPCFYSKGWDTGSDLAFTYSRLNRRRWNC